MVPVTARPRAFLAWLSGALACACVESTTNLDAGENPANDAHVPGEAGDSALPGADASGNRTDGSAPSGDAARDASTVDLDAAASAQVRPLEAARYRGSVGGSELCYREYEMIGFAPNDATRHPLFLHFAGTSITAGDPGVRFDGEAPIRVIEAMARRGFVALAVDYDNGLAADTSKLSCLFGEFNARNVFDVACELPGVDCELGIATWGHGQGALMAHAASYFEPRVRATWTTGYGGFEIALLEPSRFRVVNGEADTPYARPDVMNRAARIRPEDCPDGGVTECLREDGSGWILVRKSACGFSSADHCWFNKATCLSTVEELEPNWIDAESEAPFGLEINADWVARTVAR